MNLRTIDWIWHIRGSVPLPPGQSADEAFGRLEPLFDQPGTSHERADDALVFLKKDQAAQDKMSVFDSGVLRVENPGDGPELRYDLVSRALLYCFFAPLLFLGFAQLAITFGKVPEPDKAEAAAGKGAGKAKKAAKEKAVPQLNPVDTFLGAPAPEKKKKDSKDKDKEKEKKPSPTPAFVFAGIFAALYIGGRILEAWLIRRQFARHLLG